MKDDRSNRVFESDGESPAPADTNDATAPTRRTMLGRSAKLLVYTAPLIQLVKPPEAAAGSVSPVS